MDPNIIATLKTGRVPLRITNIRQANERISELEAQLAARPVPSPPNISPVANPAQAFAGGAAQSQSKALTLSQLTALHSFVFGTAKTEASMANHADWSAGGDELRAAQAACDAASRQYGPRSKQASDAAKQLGRVSLAIKSRRAGTDADRQNRLAKDFLTAGLTVPGLKFSGQLDVNRCAASAIRDPKLRARMQSQVDAFCAGIAGDFAAATADGATGRAIRNFIANHGNIPLQ
jgi:hypothetical protein